MASIDYIEGIGTVSARKLRKSGVRTTEALLKRAKAKKGRKALAAATTLPERQILEWVNRADLMRVKGVGSEYSDLLEAAGVDTVKELRRRNPEALITRMTQLNEQKRLVRRLPTLGMVTGWVEYAKSLDPAVTH